MVSRNQVMLGLLVLSSSVHAGVPVPSRTAVLTGVDDALGPGLGAGVFFRTIASPSRIPNLADDSRFAFAATLEGAGVNTGNDSCVWIAGVGSPSLLIREGAAAPGLPGGVTVGQILTASINNSGRMVMHARLLGLEPQGATIRGYFSFKDSKNVLIAREGQLLTDIDGESYSIAVIEEPSFAGPDHLYFRAAIGPTPGVASNDWAVFQWSEEGVRLIARRQVPAPGFETGIAFASAAGSNIGTSHDGHMAFNVNVGPNGSSPLTSVVYELADDTFAPRVPSGPAPGLPGVTFSPYDPVINDAGDTAFFAFLSGPPVPTTDVAALMLARNGETPEFIVRAGQVAESPARVFSEFESLSMNQHADVTFVVATRIPPSAFNEPTSVWRADALGRELVAATGQPAPGTDQPAVFERFTSASINDQGAICFAANAETASHTLLPGVWAMSPSGRITPIASAGAAVEVREGDIRVPTFGVFAEGSRTRRPLNAHNEVLHWCAFPDEQYALRVAVVPPGCPADFNADGTTDGRDLSILLSTFGQTGESPLPADANRDRSVDGRDLSVLLAGFGCQE